MLMVSNTINKEQDSQVSSKNSVGSSENQITVFTARIKNLTEHLKINKKDHNTRRGLMKLVGKRKKLLSYLKKKNTSRYDSIIKSLGLRRKA
ncbi:MAG: 30S ribosomal protein S15 [Rickettsiales bacterium]|nr:30S ribosomal protein S15 [Rickettsiales bacterium]